ncbi:MAG: glycosyltransferase [Pseudomonadota bacterium]
MAINVIMPSYNGAGYLGAQLDSLRHQTLRPSKVLVRDDGSVDATKLMLNRWAKDWPTLEVVDDNREHLGVTASIHQLLREVAKQPGAALTAFADQDDVWLPEKLERAAEWHATVDRTEGRTEGRTGGRHRPALYCAGALLADQKMQLLGQAPIWCRPMSLHNALVENVALGCTIVINQPALELLTKDWPTSVIAHDWWAYLVVAAHGGAMHYDPRPALHYRQHDRNAIGYMPSVAGRWRRRLARLTGGHLPPLFKQARGLLTAYEDTMSTEAKAVLHQFLQRASGWPRLAALINPVGQRQRGLDNLALRLLMASGSIK